MKIKTSNLPDDSLLKKSQTKYNYIDSYKGVLLNSTKEITANDLGRAFFSSAPKWVEKLFALRNRLVGIFGLKTPGKPADKQMELDNFKFNIGERLGLFQVFDKNDHELILGEDDKHLNFRISLYVTKSTEAKSGKEVIITTTVIFNNWFGRLYFLPVKPFHKFIVPSMLKRMINEIERNKK